MAARVFRRLRDLLDVTVSSPADGEVLTYDSGTAKWKNEAGGVGGSLPGIGESPGVAYVDPTVKVIGGADSNTPLQDNGVVISDVYTQENNAGGGDGLYWTGNGTDGEQILHVYTGVGAHHTILADADGNIDPAGTVINLPNPTNAQDAATKDYVDDVKVAALTADLDVNGNDLLNVASIVGAGAGHVFALQDGTSTLIEVSDSDGLSVGLDPTNRIGFYGQTPIAKQTGVAVDAAAIHAALVSLGLISA